MSGPNVADHGRWECTAREPDKDSSVSAAEFACSRTHSGWIGAWLGEVGNRAVSSVRRSRVTFRVKVKHNLRSLPSISSGQLLSVLLYRYDSSTLLYPRLCDHLNLMDWCVQLILLTLHISCSHLSSLIINVGLLKCGLKNRDCTRSGRTSLPNGIAGRHSCNFSQYLAIMAFCNRVRRLTS